MNVKSMYPFVRIKIISNWLIAQLTKRYFALLKIIPKNGLDLVQSYKYGAPMQT